MARFDSFCKVAMVSQWIVSAILFIPWLFGDGELAELLAAVGFTAFIISLVGGAISFIPDDDWRR